MRVGDAGPRAPEARPLGSGRIWARGKRLSLSPRFHGAGPFASICPVIRCGDVYRKIVKQYNKLSIRDTATMPQGGARGTPPEEKDMTDIKNKENTANNDIKFRKSIRFKFSIIFLIFAVVMITSIYWIMLTVITRMEEDLIADRLIADIRYIEDLIGRGQGHWNIKEDGAIYLGDVLVGDGTHERANLAPFLDHEDKTKTFSYVFIRCSDEGLGYVPDKPGAAGYQEGHYLRVAGSTRAPDGSSIVGTYITKNIEEAVDKYDTYGGEANVAGGMIYCRYNALKNEQGKTVGVIVVGRNISELKAQVNTVMRTMSINIVGAVFLLGSILMLVVNRWTRAIGVIVVYLKKIERGAIPDDALKSQTDDEMGTLVTGINHMVDSLREKEALRKKSETDPLTGLANRFGLNNYFEAVYEQCYQEQKSLAIGIMDIDFFKPFNDHYGHQAGDDCIIMLAEVLKKVGEKYDVFCARFGGDEFITICVGRDIDDLTQIAQEIKDGVIASAVPHAYSKVTNIVTISQGYCYGVPQPRKKLNDYIQVADGAMYDVKEKTKNDFKIVKMTDDFRPVPPPDEG